MTVATLKIGFQTCQMQIASIQFYAPYLLLRNKVQFKNDRPLKQHRDGVTGIGTFSNVTSKVVLEKRATVLHLQLSLTSTKKVRARIDRRFSEKQDRGLFMIYNMRFTNLLISSARAPASPPSK